MIIPIAHIPDGVRARAYEEISRRLDFPISAAKIAWALGSDDRLRVRIEQNRMIHHIVLETR